MHQRSVITLTPGDRLRVIRDVAGFATGAIVLVSPDEIVTYRRPAYVLVEREDGERVELPMDSVKKLEE